MPRATLFIDNGGYNIKALYIPSRSTHNTTDTAELTASTAHRGSGTNSNDAGASASPPLPQPRALCLPNCIGAAPHAGTGLLGDQLIHLPHYHGIMLRRPVDRGFVVDGALQARIWEHVLQHFAIEDEAAIDVWVTVPHGVPKPVAQLLWLLCTRSFRFASVTFVSSSFLSLVADSFGARSNGGEREAGPHTSSSSISSSSLASHAHEGATAADGGSEKLPSSAPVPHRKRARRAADVGRDALRGGTAVVVDVGFSGTTIVPFVDYLPVLSSAVRLDIGGKLLTNRLKEFLSFSQVNVMEDTWLINHVREVCCVVALRPWQSLQRYAALWKGKTRADVDASLPSTHTVQHRRRTSVTAVPERDADAAAAAAAEAPLRFFLPTIPALLPLGVLETELSARLPRSSAVDATALQHLLLCQERFLIPELLFTPLDVGLDQQGLVQAITEGIFQRGLLRHTSTLLRPQLLSRLCVYGGTADTPLLRERVAVEVAAASPESGSGEDDDDCASSSSSSSNVLPPPQLPDFLREAAVKGAVKSPLSLQPLLGAYYLLCPFAAAAVSPASQQELRRLRALVEQRSTVELLQPTATRITVEDFQEALRQVL